MSMLGEDLKYAAEFDRGVQAGLSEYAGFIKQTKMLAAKHGHYNNMLQRNETGYTIVSHAPEINSLKDLIKAATTLILRNL